MASRKQEETSKVDLLHPVYLDASMLISFLATLDDGVSFSSEVAQKRMQAGKSNAQIDGSAKLPSIASLLGLDLSASGKYSRDKSEDNTTESKFVRQHTAASLFNRLRTLLVEEGIVSIANQDSDLNLIAPGSMLEITGALDQTPLKKIADLFSAMWPFIQDGQPELPPVPHANRRQQRQGGGLSAEQRQAVQLAQTMREVATAKREENKNTMKMVELVEQDLGEVASS